MLALYELLYLLILDEDKGNLIRFTRKSFAYSMAGTILAELVLSGKLGVDEKLRLTAQAGEISDDPILDGVLQEIKGSEKVHKPAYWVSQFSSEPKKLRHSIGEKLASANVLTQDEKRFFRYEPARGAEAPAPSKFEIKHELRALIFSNGERNLRNITLLKMLAASDLLCLCFTQDELDIAEQAIHTHLLSTALEDSRMELVEEIGQAVSTVMEDEME